MVVRVAMVVAVRVVVIVTVRVVVAPVRCPSGGGRTGFDRFAGEAGLRSAVDISEWNTLLLGDTGTVGKFRGKAGGLPGLPGQLASHGPPYGLYGVRLARLLDSFNPMPTNSERSGLLEQ